MEAQNTSVPSESRPRYWRRVLRPLAWWLLLVLVLFAIRTHQRLMERTRLDFTVSLAGNTIFPEPVAMLDGKEAYNDQLVSLGNHQFTVTHPKGEPFATNLFIWYGGHNFGNIDLKRAKGTLSIRVDPPAPRLSIQGPEFSVTLTNSTGFSDSVPTDQYTVEAQYRHWQKSQTIAVNENSACNLTIAPKIGALQLACNQSEATFQLLNLDDQLVEAGDFPATIVELPEAGYKLVALHHNHQWTEYPAVKGGITNTVTVEFKYGKATLETIPAGAAVTSNGHYLGVTPLTLTELQPGTWNFDLRLDNYEPITATLAVAAYETASFYTNLVSQSYTGAMRSARGFMDAANYKRAIEALDDALRVQSDDPAATALRREAIGLANIQRAETLGNKGDYVAGELALNNALIALPDNERAKQMLADFKQHEPAQLEQIRLERLNRPRVVYNEALGQYTDVSLFEDHELKTAKPASEAAAAIVQALQTGQPPFKVTRSQSPKPDTFAIEAMLELPGLLGEGTTSGRRRCIIVCGQTTDQETEILFKVMEYTAKTTIKFSIANLLQTATTDNVNYIPIHPSRLAMTDKLQAQLAAGVADVTARIQGAVGQTPTVQPSAPQ
jgi:tetratricopeptide (TPR) repeat protein